MRKAKILIIENKKLKEESEKLESEIIKIPWRGLNLWIFLKRIQLKIILEERKEGKSKPKKIKKKRRLKMNEIKNKRSKVVKIKNEKINIQQKAKHLKQWKEQEKNGKKGLMKLLINIVKKV